MFHAGLRNLLVLCELLLLHSVISSQYKLRCKPKPGCDFSKCDPIPEWLHEIEGADIEGFRKRNAYHILCEPSPSEIAKICRNEPGCSSNAVELTQEVAKLKAEMKEMREEFKEMLNQREIVDNLESRVDALEDRNYEDLNKKPMENEVVERGPQAIKPAGTCQHPKVHTYCASECPRTCYDMAPRPCGESCDQNIKCVCSEGFVLADDQRLNDTCVLLRDCPGMCELTYSGSCFFWEELKWINYIDGNKVCKIYGAKLANVYNFEHFRMIKQYFRTAMRRTEDSTEERKQVEVVLGMNYNTRTGQVTLVNGSADGWYVEWSRADGGWPRRNTWDRRSTRISLIVHKDPKDENQGMRNLEPGASVVGGALCEF